MTTTATLAELAVQYPAAARVFYRHRLDFCCGGRRRLDQACRDRGLDPDAILTAIAAEAPQPADLARWETQPLEALIDHITQTYHARLRQSLPQLVAMAQKVEARHGDKDSCPVGLAAHLAEMHQAVLDHLDKEEQILFPMIARGNGGRASAPIHALEIEHEHHREHLLDVRALTDGLTPPDNACVTWRALYAGLSQLEQELMEHIHLENNVLFPRALEA